MSTGTLPAAKKPRQLFAADANRPNSTFKGHAIEHRDDGTAVVKDVAIFKAGSFRDSWGDQHTWTAEHLQQMVSNFNLLRDSGVFPDVPVRRDHSFTVDKVMGYFESVRTDGVMLYGDLHITEGDSLDKVARGTFRSRSLEVGMYETNDGASYWPVIFGVAYVDIPAVEGLHSKEIALNYFSYVDPKENTLSGAANQPTTPPDDRGASRPAPVQFRIAGVETSDHAKVQAHIEAIEKRNEQLEQFAKDQAEAARKAFVSSLVADRKIVAPQEEAMTALVLTMSDEQYDKFKATYAEAPAISLLANHGGSGDPDAGRGESEKDEAIAVARETVEMHRRAGMTEERIKNTTAYKRLIELTTKS